MPPQHISHNAFSHTISLMSLWIQKNKTEWERNICEEKVLIGSFNMFFFVMSVEETRKKNKGKLWI